MSLTTAQAGPAAARSPTWLAIYSMWLREVIRFLRQKSRLMGALATPLVFWIVLGAGFGKSVATGGDASYLEFFFPGIVVLTVLFTAIYSTISLIEDRQQGFLQGVLVAPASRAGVVVGKMLGGTTLAMLEAAILILLAPLVGLDIGWSGMAAGLAVLLPIAFALTGLGLVIAWSMESTAGFHAIMNLLLMPMWMLSGAVFPAATAHPVLRVIMIINPLAYGLDGLRRALYINTTGPGGAQWPLWVGVGVSLLFAAATAAASIALANRRGESGR